VGRPLPSRIAALALALSLSLMLAACTTRESPDSSGPLATRPPGTPGTMGPEPAESLAPAPALDWESCAGDTECAVLDVPLDYEAPLGETIELAIARRPARDGDNRLGVLLVNPGGPGASGVGYIQSGALGELDRWFDVVGWDPRGVGESTPLECSVDRTGAATADELRTLDPTPDDAAEQAELDDTARALAELCGELDAAYLENIDSTVNARDIDQIRRALDEDEVSFVGYSYGTLLGHEYARLFPGRVRAMVLDGVVNPAKELTEFLRDQALGLEAALEPLGDQYDRVAERVEREPLPTRRGAEVGPAELALAAFASS
jgi:pimeloyl-ACP methyl ester carboxylesterase